MFEGFWFVFSLFFFFFLEQAEQRHAFIILKEPQMMHISPQALFQQPKAFVEFLSRVKTFRSPHRRLSTAEYIQGFSGRDSCWGLFLSRWDPNTWLSWGYVMF